MTAAARWAAVLDEFAAALDSHRHAAAGTGDVVAFDPPAGLPPLPAELVGRARRLLAEARMLEGELVTGLQLARDRALAVGHVRAAAAGLPAHARLVDRLT